MSCARVAPPFDKKSSFRQVPSQGKLSEDS